jgi:hypothetical protein
VTRSGYRIVSAEGSRPVELHPPTNYFPIDAGAGRFGVVAADGTFICYTHSERRAWELVVVLRVLELDEVQLARLLDDPRLLRTIVARFGDRCFRCGRAIRPGAQVRWNRATRLARHLRTCPKPTKAKSSPKSKASAKAKAKRGPVA